MATPYLFRPMNADDMPLIRRWLAEPHVAEWWHDPETLAFVSGDLEHHDLAQFIVNLDGRPFAYLQCYRIGDWHESFGPQPEGTRGLDPIAQLAVSAALGCDMCISRLLAADLFLPKFQVPQKNGRKGA